MVIKDFDRKKSFKAIVIALALNIWNNSDPCTPMQFNTEKYWTVLLITTNQ